ncbi:NADPH-dependent F420 reductase [Nocardioides acrostichi]|uniref:NAD(P)-binding domain-containing protein n=1 Tax=Nocardioides acrostichi TaxID=2784339 RepID=A0A930V4W3_9ACTN|nr:NAD(P)-binding domain-containing protein [Nocardioides acrostichi]MBF4163800.1 NAD(P)-binding domain-containing protein [Nocardioides acrostichi]
MTTIGLIGSGNIGSTVARLAVDAGYDVVVSNSRGPETLADLATDLGPRARAASAADAAVAGDLVVVTIPLGKIDGLPADQLAGKTVIDTCNYYPERDGAIAALDDKQATTSELVAQQLPGASVVKGFNNIFFKHLGSLQRPSGAEDRATLMIAGDDADAKARVAAFFDAIGYDTFDTGSLADSWRFQRDQPAYAGAYAVDGNFEHPRAATRSDLEPLLAQADSSIR